jgi:predicted dehydrogenase
MREPKKLSTLIVGLGNAGLGLHWEVLRRARRSTSATEPFSGQRPVAYDPRPVPSARWDDDLVVVRRLEQARELLDPAQAVVHLCTPPSTRLEVVAELAELGFRQILLEKPLATSHESLDALVELRGTARLRMMVVAHWLQSALTRRLHALVTSQSLGELRSVSVVQRKPRFVRSLRGDGHPTAFDVELPHSVGIALHLAGDAKVTAANCSDMHLGDLVVPRMGTARLALQHDGGTRTDIFSDLTSPVRERRIELVFDRGHATGYYPESRDDHYAHVSVAAAGEAEARVVFPDDSLAAFLVYAYRQFAHGAEFDHDFDRGVRVTSLLCDAKTLCAVQGSARVVGMPRQAGTVEHAS